MFHFWRNQLAMNVKKARIQTETVKYLFKYIIQTHIEIQLITKDMILL